MTANLWSNNLDDSMAQYSPLGHLLPERVLRLNQVLPPVLLPYGVALAYIAIVAPPAIYWIQRIRGLDVSDGGFGLRNVGWLKLTSFIAFFLVPTLACYFVPASSAKDLGANVALNSLQRTRSTHFHSQLLELEPGTRIIVRNFTMEQKTKAFSLDVNTSGLPYSGTLVAELNAINAPASRNAYKLSSAVKASKDNSFPGFKGWLEVAFLDRVGYLPAGKSVLTLTNHSSQSIKLWLDTVRPTQSTVVDGSTVLPGAALVTGFYTSKR